MTKEAKDTVEISISKEIMDFINERIDTRQFANTSHAFELMAFEFMKNLDPKDESTIQKLQKLTLGTARKSVGLIRDTAETVQDSTMKVVHGSSEKVKDSSIMKGVKDSAGKVQDGTMKAVRFSTGKVKDSVGKVKETISREKTESSDQACSGKKSDTIEGTEEED